MMPAEKSKSLIFQTFRRLTEAEPAAVAVIDGWTGKAANRQELFHRAEGFARELSDLNLSTGDAIALQLPNCAQWLAAALAILRSGLVLVPIDRDAKEGELVSIADQLGLRAVIQASSVEAPVRIVRREAPSISIDLSTALIKLTSGSTGQPKGILTSERNLIADCGNVCSTMQIGFGDRNFGAIPFSHSYGFSNLVTPLFLQGTPIVISNDYMPLSVIEKCNRFECTVLPGIPMLFQHLSELPAADGEFTSVRTFISAGAPLPPDVSRKFRERFGIPIHSFYGCSECGGIAYDRDGSAVERGVVGTPLDRVTPTVDAQSRRLSIESAAVAIGYLNSGSGEAGRFDGSRFATEDMAELHENGEIELIGRFGDLINIAGKKVNPREIEAVLLELAGVRQARVYGAPGGARGEVVAAVLVASPELTREKVREYCRLRLSSHKVPRIVKFIDEMPVDERGKFKRSALRDV